MRITVQSGNGINELSCHEGQTILDALLEAGIAIAAVCGGHGTCGRCLVQVGQGADAPWHLACEERVRDGMYVRVPERAPMVVQERGAAFSGNFELTPFEPIALSGEAESAVAGAAASAHEAASADVPTSDVSPTSGDASAFASEQLPAFGLAVDVGTTTVVAHLHNLHTGARLATAGCVNPQGSFGADVISRISASMDGKLALMTQRIVEAVCAMKGQLCARAGVDPALCSVSAVAGNTVMEHIFVGLLPDSIGVSPFEPLSLFGDVRKIEGLGPTYMVPAVAGYVGGDIVAGLLACGYGRDAAEGAPHEGQDGAPAQATNSKPSTRLFLDLGTNGEMALSHNGEIACCATAAGPVFEGAGIACGTPATPGAISHVRISNGEVAITTVGDEPATSICGTGVVDAVAALLNCGVIDETGLLLEDDEVEEAYAARLGERDGFNVFYLTEDQSVYITQKDVRNVQLAKAAVAGGVHTLMAHFGIQASDIEAVEIAGGFGAFIDVASAARIGLFPPQLKDRATSVGNASAEGASAMLLSAAARDFAGNLARKCRYIELSTSQEFNQFYVEQMAFEE